MKKLPIIILVGIVSILLFTGESSTDIRGGSKSNKEKSKKNYSKKWKIKSATGDGSCLFNAIIGFLYAEKHVKINREIEKGFSSNLRNDVLKFYMINKNKIGPAGLTWEQFIEGDYSIPFDMYIQRMTPTSAWGGQPEISAIATILKRSVYVLDSSFEVHKVYGQKISGSKEKPIYLYYNNSHFDYLVRK